MQWVCHPQPVEPGNAMPNMETYPTGPRDALHERPSIPPISYQRHRRGAFLCSVVSRVLIARLLRRAPVTSAYSRAGGPGGARADGHLMATKNLTPVEKDTYLLVARLIREGRRKLEKQRRLNILIDEEQLALLAQIADKAQAAAMEGVQPDLLGDGGR